MALKSGLAAQFGFKTETTWNTGVTPDKFVDFRSESIAQNLPRIESKAIRANARFMRPEDWSPGTIASSGSVELELQNKVLGGLFGAMIGGSVVTTGPVSSVYTHTWTPGDLPSLTLQVGRTQNTGTVTPFTYTGAMVKGWELACAKGDVATLKLDFIAAAETRATALATATYPTGLEMFTFVGGSVLVDAATPTVVPVAKVSLKGDNALKTDRYFLGSRSMSQPLETSLRSIAGDFECEYVASSSLYDLFVNGTEANLTLTFAGTYNPTHKLVVTTHIRVDGDTPTVGGTDIVNQPIKFMGLGATDAAAITVAYSTLDATP